MESLGSEPNPNPYQLWAAQRRLIYEMGKLTVIRFGGGGRVQSIVNDIEEVMLGQINEEMEDHERGSS